jgi:undecaprenyl-diphosphatase
MLKTLRKISLVMLIVALIMLIALAFLVHYHSIFRLDVFLSRDLQLEGDTPERRSLIFHFLVFISYFGKPVISAILVVGSALVFWLLKYYRETVFCLLTPLAAGINAAVKIIVDRPRPSQQLVQILDRELDPSFPSGHVVFYTVFFGFIFVTMFVIKKIPFWLRMIVAAICFGMIVAISISRVYLGAHWFSDILGGYLLGFALLLILLNFYLMPYIKQKTHQ